MTIVSFKFRAYANYNVCTSILRVCVRYVVFKIKRHKKRRKDLFVELSVIQFSVNKTLRVTHSFVGSNPIRVMKI